VLETGGDDRQIAKLTKDIRAAAQKAKSDVDFRPTSARNSSRRWPSTDDDYMPDGPQSRSAAHDDLESRSRPRRDSRSRPADNRADQCPSSRQQRARTEDGYGLRGSYPS